jgi:hypothetical protein
MFEFRCSQCIHAVVGILFAGAICILHGCEVSVDGTPTETTPTPGPDTAIPAPAPSPPFAGKRVVVGDVEFLYVQERLKWTAAEAKCVDLGGHLAKIENAEQNSAVSNLIGSDLIYIGGNDMKKEGEWVWADGTPLSGYNNWVPGKPNNAGGSWESPDYKGEGEDCAGFGNVIHEKKDDTWNDISCGVDYPDGRPPNGFVCSRQQ